MSDFDIEKTLSSEYANISKDMLEIGIDSIMEDGLFKEIPVFSTLTSLAKIGANIKDRLFLKKLVHFLYETQRVPKNEREKVIKKINTSKEYQTKVGEKIIFILDKSDETTKARLIGKLFSFVLEEKLNYNMYIRCSTAINMTFEPDLKCFLRMQLSEYNDGIEKDGLINSGILKVVSAEGESTFGTSVFNLNYDVSEVGIYIHKYLSNKETDKR